MGKEERRTRKSHVFSDTCERESKKKKREIERGRECEVERKL